MTVQVLFAYSDLSWWDVKSKKTQPLNTNKLKQFEDLL